MPLAFMEYAPADFDERVRESTEGELAKAAEQIDYPKELVSTALRFRRGLSGDFSRKPRLGERI